MVIDKSMRVSSNPPDGPQLSSLVLHNQWESAPVSPKCSSYPGLLWVKLLDHFFTGFTSFPLFCSLIHWLIGCFDWNSLVIPFNIIFYKYLLHCSYLRHLPSVNSLTRARHAVQVFCLDSWIQLQRVRKHLLHPRSREVESGLQHRLASFPGDGWVCEHLHCVPRPTEYHCQTSKSIWHTLLATHELIWSEVVIFSTFWGAAVRGDLSYRLYVQTRIEAQRDFQYNTVRKRYPWPLRSTCFFW